MEKNDVMDGVEYCSRCKTPLMEKIPLDKKQIREVIRFYCLCGYYKDIPIEELISKGWQFVN
jgi:hypothetical protein